MLSTNSWWLWPLWIRRQDRSVDGRRLTERVLPLHRRLLHLQLVEFNWRLILQPILEVIQQVKDGLQAGGMKFTSAESSRQQEKKFGKTLLHPNWGRWRQQVNHFIWVSRTNPMKDKFQATSETQITTNGFKAGNSICFLFIVPNRPKPMGRLEDQKVLTPHHCPDGHIIHFSHLWFPVASWCPSLLLDQHSLPHFYVQQDFTQFLRDGVLYGMIQCLQTSSIHSA